LALDTFWIKSQNSTFIALKKKIFGIKFHAAVKNAILAIFQKGLGLLCPVTLVSALKKKS
jgi:hypothetical protein